MCSLLCSSDVVAAVSLLSYDQQPKLFSIVFGEGIINDAVSIILFNTVEKFVKDSDEDDYSIGKYLTIIGNFFNLLFKSVFLGIVFGLLSATLLKKFRSFTHNAVH